MPTRGKTLKHETPERTVLLRPMVTRRWEFVADHTKCCGCTTCATVCPHEAITLREAEVVDGQVITPTRIIFDEAKCAFCGECVVLCPTHALSMTVNGKREVPVIKGEAFPFLVHKISVDQAPCRATTDVEYIEACPSGAISADIEHDASGAVTSVDNVAIDRQKCISCTHCMEEGPEGAFEVTKPYKGRTFLNVLLCPEGCQACAQVCPSNAITFDGERVWLDQRFCLFCGACEQVCPAEGAVRIVRTGYVHTPIVSAAWTAALEKLVSYQEAIRELDRKGQHKRRALVLQGLLGEGPEASS